MVFDPQAYPTEVYMREKLYNRLGLEIGMVLAVLAFGGLRCWTIYP